jgi:hypothetical protein
MYSVSGLYIEVCVPTVAYTSVRIFSSSSSICSPGQAVDPTAVCPCRVGTGMYSNVHFEISLQARSPVTFAPRSIPYLRDTYSTAFTSHFRWSVLRTISSKFHITDMPTVPRLFQVACAPST